MKVGCLKGSIALISHITILMIIFFGAFSPQPTASCSPGELRLYIISCERCEGIRDRVDVLVHTFPSAVMTFYEIEEENNAIRFNEISKAVGEILYMPLVGIYLDETLISVASGGFSPEGWVEAAESPVEGVTVYLPDAQGRASSIVTIADPDTLNALSRLFIG